MKQKSPTSTIVKDLSAAAAALRGSQSAAERAHQEEIALVKADLQPLAERAQAAAEALQEIFAEYDSLVASFHREQENSWLHAGRTAVDYSRLQAEVDKYHAAKQTLYGLRGVPGTIHNIALLPPSRRPSEIEQLSKTVAMWCERPQALTERVLPSIAFYGQRVAQRESEKRYGN